MSETQFLILALVAFLVTMPTVKWIPRARQSRSFDLVLWGATWLMAFIGAWYAVGQLQAEAPLATLDAGAFVRTAGMSIAIGALGGALTLNLALWLMDRLMPLAADEIPDTSDNEHDGDSISQSSDS